MSEHDRKIKKPVKNGVASVPVIMQLEALECGAACLAMVLAYYGKWIPLEQVRLICGVSRDGSNARSVLMAARHYGLKADAFHAEPEQLKQHGEYPCIIHWNFNHFVVLDGFKRGKVYLNDPARGRVIVSEEEFDRSFTGVVMMFDTTESFEPSGSPKSVIAFAKKRLKGARTALAFVILLSVITALFGLISPAMDRIFIDRLLTRRNPNWLYPFILVLTALAVLQVVTGWIQAVNSLRINGKMAVVGNMTFMWKVLRLPMDFFSQRMAGDLLQRKSTNAFIANSLVNTLAPLLLNSAMMILYLSVMIRQSLFLTAVGIVSMALNLVTSIIVSKRRVNITRVQQRDSGKLQGTTLNGIQMIETIKASGAEAGFFRNWAGLQASVNTQEVAFTKLNLKFGLIPALCSALSNLAVLVVGIYLTMQGRFTAGMIVAFQGYLTSFMAPVSSLLSAGQTLQEMRTDMERIEDVMEYRDAVPETQPSVVEGFEYSKLSGAIEMRNVTFGYAKLRPPLIENFNMSVSPGSRVAFVGASGCGKSTLSKLISGLYEPWSGEILFDGKPIHEINRSVFTGSLAVVDQDIILFEDTIAENIRMWDSSIEDFEIIMAARDAQIHDDIMKREGGYAGKLSEGGKDLSGGQRQRLELARVLAQDPTIIILDEATSALDAKTEYNAVKSITDRGITCIVIAHRLSTIRDCDEIIVLDHGKVAERGTHEELYAKGGLYTSLVTNE